MSDNDKVISDELAQETYDISVADNPDVPDLDVDKVPVVDMEEAEAQDEEETEEEKPKKEKKPKPEKGKGRQSKGKGAEKGFSKGEAWWKETGAKLQKKEYSPRNIILRAAKASNSSFDRAMDVMKSTGTIEEKAKALFNE